VSALALDRQAIEKKDFPISRRGYEPEAVDLHLETLAGEVERLQGELDRTQRAAATAGAPVPPPPPAAPAAGVQSLALVASEQVRMIVEAAETSAADIERSAQEEAARIRADADTESRRARDEAISRSQDHVGNVSEATTSMLQRVDAMENELEALVESLRTGTNRLTADLSLLQGNLGDLYGAAGSTRAPAPPLAAASLDVPAEIPVVVPEPVTPEALEPEEVEPLEPELELESEELLAPEPELVDDEPVVLAPAEPVAEPEPEDDPEPEIDPEPDPAPEPDAPAVESPPAEAAPPDRRASEGDVEGARLIALNMALNGQSRDETDTYLRENFDLDDRVALLDEVYATVEG